MKPGMNRQISFRSVSRIPACCRQSEMPPQPRVLFFSYYFKASTASAAASGFIKMALVPCVLLKPCICPDRSKSIYSVLVPPPSHTKYMVITSIHQESAGILVRYSATALALNSSPPGILALRNIGGISPFFKYRFSIFRTILCAINRLPKVEAPPVT